MGEITPKNEEENPAPKRRKRLRPRELKFCAHYAANQNATEAYFYAYGRYRTVDGKRVAKSYSNAAWRANRLKKREEIKREIERATKAITKTIRMDATKWLKILSFWACQDEADLYQSDPHTGLPQPKPWKELTPAQRKLVKVAKCKIRRIKGGRSGLIEEVENAEYVPHDRLKALELIGKRLGLLNEPTPLDQLIAMLPASAAEVLKRAIAEEINRNGQGQPKPLPEGEKPAG